MTSLADKPKHPFCPICGWRKGGVDSWDGVRCKCGISAPPMPSCPTCGKGAHFANSPVTVICDSSSHQFDLMKLEETSQFFQSTAQTLGRKGGQSKSPAKQAAVRANVAKARAAKQKRQNAPPEPTTPSASQAE